MFHIQYLHSFLHEGRAIRALRLVGLAFAIFLLLAPGSLLAKQTANTASKPVAAPRGIPGAAAEVHAPPPWSDQTKYEACGQACLMGKGNEKLSQEALYTYQYARLLKGLIEDSRESEVKSQLGRFCLRQETGTKCYQRFVQVSALRLQKIRSALIKNMSNIYDLKSGHNGNVVARAIDEKNPKKLSHNPDFTRTDALIQAYPELAMQLEKKVAVRGTVWEQGMPTGPNPEDCLVFEEIPRDPTDPTSDRFLQAVKAPGPDGKLAYVYDESSPECQKSKKYYDDVRSKIGRNDTLSQEVQAVYGQKPQAFMANTHETEGQMSQERQMAYRYSRNILIGKGNSSVAEARAESLKRKKEQEKFKKDSQKRVLASKNAKDPSTDQPTPDPESRHSKVEDVAIADGAQIVDRYQDLYMKDLEPVAREGESNSPNISVRFLPRKDASEDQLQMLTDSLLENIP